MSKQRIITTPFVLRRFLALLPVSAGSAQAFRGRISGILTAEFKAAVAGANVTLNKRRLCLSSYAGHNS